MLSADAYNLPPAGAVIPATEARPDELLSVPDCVITPDASAKVIPYPLNLKPQNKAFTISASVSVLICIAVLSAIEKDI
jgi:hypothetical protein